SHLWMQRVKAFPRGQMRHDQTHLVSSCCPRIGQGSSNAFSAAGIHTAHKEKNTSGRMLQSSGYSHASSCLGWDTWLSSEFSVLLVATEVACLFTFSVASSACSGALGCGVCRGCCSARSTASHKVIIRATENRSRTSTARRANAV